MNDPSVKNQDSYRELMLMSELEGGAPISQREIAGRLGIALGLVNSYLKNLVRKGFVTVKDYPRNRFAYLLTPQGFAEKSRLALEHLSNFNRHYRSARIDSLAIFLELREAGIDSVSFCGIDEMTEIAFLSLKESGVNLNCVMDDDEVGNLFLGHDVVTMSDGVVESDCPIVLTSLRKSEQLLARLIDLGVSQGRIFPPLKSYSNIIHSKMEI